MNAGVFLNRREAGRELATQLAPYASVPDVVVLGLPRGGVPVAYQIAMALDAPLNPFLVRTVSPPLRDDQPIGFVATGGVRVFPPGVRSRGIGRFGRPIGLCEEAELARRERDYLGGADPLPVQNRTVILVDDGITTGSSMRAAIRALRERRPAEIVVAVPVAPPDVFDDVRSYADAGTCLRTPAPFDSVESWYRYYAPTSDGEVRELVALAREKGFGTRGLRWPPAWGERFGTPVTKEA